MNKTGDKSKSNAQIGFKVHHSNVVTKEQNTQNSLASMWALEKKGPEIGVGMLDLIPVHIYLHSGP